MVEPQPIPRNEFPMSPSSSEGMIPITVSADVSFTYCRRDVVYQKRGATELHLQILSPVAPNAVSDPAVPLLPLVLYIPGSAFHKQDVPAMTVMAGLVACRGFVVAMVEYRGSEEAPFPAQALDAKAAVRYMKCHAHEYGADPSKTVIMGDSSGGHTALMAGLTAGVPSLEEPDEKNCSSAVNGIIDIFGPVNIATMNQELSSMDHRSADSPEGFLIGQNPVLEHPELVKPTVVTNYISPEREIPPVLIIHGSNDELVPFSQSCELYDAMKAAGKEADFYQILGAHHGGPEFWSSEVIRLMEEFIRRVTGAAQG